MVAERTRVGDTVRSMVTEVESELTRLITYLNDDVVPEVRRSSSYGLRAAAEHLGRMAEQLDRGSRGRPAAQSGNAQQRSAQAEP